LDGKIIIAAPIAGWAKNCDKDYILNWFKSRGATVTLILANEA